MELINNTFIPENEIPRSRRDAGRKAFLPVGAVGLLANGGQPLFVQQGRGGEKTSVRSQRAAQPCGLAQGGVGRVGLNALVAHILGCAGIGLGHA